MTRFEFPLVWIRCAVLIGPAYSNVYLPYAKIRATLRVPAFQPTDVAGKPYNVMGCRLVIGRHLGVLCVKNGQNA